MAPCDFWLFPKLKMPLKGTRFESREDITRNATAQLDMIPQEAFQKCFQQWQDCCSTSTNNVFKNFALLLVIYRHL
jgi:hypothetical protein